MTVAELIAELGKLDPALPAIVRGYEGGYHDVSGVETMSIVLDVHDEPYYGPHEDADYPLLRDGLKPAEAALIG